MSDLQIKNITKRYGSFKALDDVSVTFHEGKIYGLLGRNGAGKSTLLNIITNRIFATEGTVELDGENVKENNRQLCKMYCMSEQSVLPENMKFSACMEYTKLYYHDFDTEYALSLAKKFGLNPKKRLSAYSTGYGSIAKIILALASNAPFVFFDEPVLGLDAHHRELFYKVLLEKYIENPSTYIISTHLIEECANLIENICIIKNGKVIADTTVEDLLSSAYTVTGKAADVDSYIQGRNIIGSNTIGGLKSAYINGKPDTTSVTGLEFTKANLQHLFIQMTNSGEDYDNEN